MGFDRDLMDFFNGILMEISWAHRPLNDLMAMVGIPSGKLTVLQAFYHKMPVKSLENGILWDFMKFLE